MLLIFLGPELIIRISSLVRKVFASSEDLELTLGAKLDWESYSEAGPGNSYYMNVFCLTVNPSIKLCLIYKSLFFLQGATSYIQSIWKILLAAIYFRRILSLRLTLAGFFNSLRSPFIFYGYFLLGIPRSLYNSKQLFQMSALKRSTIPKIQLLSPGSLGPFRFISSTPITKYQEIFYLALIRTKLLFVLSSLCQILGRLLMQSATRLSIANSPSSSTLTRGSQIEFDLVSEHEDYRRRSQPLDTYWKILLRLAKLNFLLEQGGMATSRRSWCDFLRQSARRLSSSSLDLDMLVYKYKFQIFSTLRIPCRIQKVQIRVLVRHSSFFGLCNLFGGVSCWASAETGRLFALPKLQAYRNSLTILLKLVPRRLPKGRPLLSSRRRW